MDSVESLPIFEFVECLECGWLYVEPKTPEGSAVFCSPGCREADLLKQLQAFVVLGKRVFEGRFKFKYQAAKEIKKARRELGIIG